MLKTGHDVYTNADNGFDQKVLYETPESEQWRLTIIKDILKVKNSDLEIKDFNNEELIQILETVCSG